MAGTDRRRLPWQGDGPAIVLVDPQLGENIGTAARAMYNCGLTDLRLVRPRDGWPSPPARAAASGADVVIDGARLFDTTEDAIADCAHVYAGTARDRAMNKRVLDPRQAAAEMAGHEQRIGLLFGGERSGLHNDDIALADTVLTVPLNPAFSSLNLAQAVLLVAYEWRMASAAPPAPLPALSEPADKGTLGHLFAHLEGALDESGFFGVPERRPSMVRNLRNTLQRAGLSEAEVKAWHGIITALSDMRRDGRRRGRGE